MSIYTLQDLRATAPAHLRNVSDYALINEYAKSSGVDPMQVAQYFGLGQQGGMASNRIGAGIDNYQANMYGLVGAGARALGANQVAGWADRNREANELQADIATLRARDLGAVDDWRDVRGIGSGLNYVGGLAAQSLPYLAEAAVGGLAARGVMTGTRAALAAAQTPQAAAAARRALNIGSMAGAVGASYPSAVGDVLSNQRDEAGVENLGSAAIGGVPYAALNAIGAEGVVARGLRPLSGVTERRMLRRMGEQGGKTALTEGVAETGQEMVNQYFGRMAVNPDQTMFNEDANRRYLDAFIGGAALGGSIGTLAGVRRPIDESFNYDLTQRDTTPPSPTTAQAGPTARLGYSPLAGTLIVFPDGSVALNGEQELQARYGTPPTPTAAPSAPTNQTQAAVDENADLDALILDRTSLKPSNKMRTFAKRIVGLDLEAVDPDTEVAVWNALAERKYGAAEKLLKAFEESAAANDRQNVVAPAGAPATQPGTGDIPALPTAATPDAAVAAVSQPPTARAGQPAGAAQNTADQGAVNRVVSSGGSTAASLPASASAGVGVSSTQTDGTQTAQAQQAAPQGSTAASIRPATGQPAAGAPSAPVEAVGVTGRSKLTLKRNEPGGLSLEDRAEIESLTGVGGEARARLGEETGRRQDAPSDEVQAQTIRDILAKRFEESTDAARDTEIALAYLTALRAAPKGSKIKVQEAIGERYGIKPVTVRKLGNTSKLVEAGRALGYSDREVRALLDINDNTKARPGESVQGEETSTAEDTQLTQGLRDAGVETLEGETAGFGFDDARTWSAPENTAEAKANAVQSLMDQIEGVRETIAELEGQGQTEVAQALSEQIAALNKRLEAAIADYNKFLGGDKRRAAEAPKTALPEDVTAAKQRLKEAKGDVTKLSDEDLPLIRDEYARLKNTDGVAKVEAEMQKRGVGPPTEAAPTEAAPTEAALRSDADRAAAAWDKVAKELEGAPLFSELPRGKQKTFIEYGEGNWTRQDVLTELAKIDRQREEAARDGTVLENIDRLTSEPSVYAEAAKRAPSLRRELTKLQKMLDKGELTPDAFAARVELALQRTQRERTRNPRERGADYIRQRLLEAKRRGDLSERAVDMAEWFILKNPALVDDLAVSIKSSKADGASGNYDPLYRLMTLIKDSSNDKTTVHEILHHLERMLPEPVRAAIRKSWAKSLTAAAKAAEKSGDADLQKFYKHLQDFHFGDAWQPTMDAATRLIKEGKVAYDHYQHVNSSEFWAVNGSRIVEGRFDAKGTVLARLKQWLRELGQKIKALFGLQSDAPIIKALDSLAKADGKFVTSNMLMEGVKYAALNKSGRKEGAEFGEAATPENAYTAKELEAELKVFMRVDTLGRNVIIVDKPTDLSDLRDVVTGLTNVRSFGWTRDGKAVLIASRIQKGMGRAKFMHEVGSHLGMQRLLPPQVFNRLVDQVISWAERTDNSLETRLAKKALARVPEDTAPASVRNEIVAYFVEEAVMAGVDPTATRQLQNPAAKWLRSVFDAMKRALVKLGMKPENLTAKDYVNLAYGAASLRMDATPGGSSDVELGSQAITDTPAFKRWFGDSKVVDAEGKPLVVYHGTRTKGEAIDSFDIEKAGSKTDSGWMGTGFYFGDQRTADAYAGHYEFDPDHYPEGGAVYPVYLSVQNPAILKDSERNDGPRTMVRELLGLADEASASEVRDGLLAAGYDGVIYERFSPYGNGYREYVAFHPEQIKSAIGNRGTFDPNDARIEYGMNPAPAAPTASTVQKNVAKLPKPMQGPVRGVLNTIADAARSALDKVVFTHVLIDRAKAAGIKSADQFSRLLAERAAKARELEREVEKIADMYADVEEKDKGDGALSLNRFLFESTRQGKWGYGDKADPEMKAWFDSLGKNSQKLAKAIFAHGDKILAQKKQAVIDYTNTEYDALIEAAQEKLNTATTADERKDARKELAELKRDKADSLKKYETLFKLREGSPYAPIKRMGNYVVVAKSSEYRAAEEAGDAKKLAELAKSGEHYHVSFTETKNEARRLADNLREQGFYGRDNEAVYFMERSTTDEELFGGDSMLQALTKLRARVDGTDNKGRAALQRMVTELWLNTLAENSARKSEMRRKGVDGEVDMLRSFAAQGRADAQFISSVQYNAATQESIQSMRKEVKRGGDRLRKSEVMNELMERYAASLDVVHNPVVDKITRMSSVYFLASSPMYYLQNLTQPWMMSVPAMAKNHNYTKVSSELFKAYSELGPVMRSGKLFETGFDFDQVPADVKEAIKTLVNRGRIDIGLDTELGEFRIDGQGAFADGWNKADKGLRLLVQKGEAINRLSTAIAAYRLELGRTNSVEAALDYTDKILLDTHGDYGQFNAPKYFNMSLGRIALQFRKFQLIQLTWYAKLVKDAFTNPAERKAALKGLGFALGHTALLAGAMGLPGYAAIAWALGAVLGDDEPFDLTYEMRKLIGNEQMANLIMRGAPTLAGADISGKVGAGTMISIMPFSNADLSTPQGQAQAAGTLIGGASLGMGMRIADGLGLMLSGDWVRGAELVLPKGLGDAIRGAREASDGVTRRNGDVILPPEEVSAVEAVMQAIGMPPVQTTVTNERRSRAFEMDKHFRERTTRIKNDYARAFRARDAEGMRRAREAWASLQEARRRNGYAVQPVSNLLRAPQEQVRRERNTAGGVQFNNSNRAFAEQQAAI